MLIPTLRKRKCYEYEQQKTSRKLYENQKKRKREKQKERVEEQEWKKLEEEKDSYG